MKRTKKMISIIGVMCLIVNLLVANATGNETIDTEEMNLSNRIPILTLTPGNEIGQVGYGGSESIGYMGPNSFVVEKELFMFLMR